MNYPEEANAWRQKVDRCPRRLTQEETKSSFSECNFIWGQWKNSGAEWWRWLGQQQCTGSYTPKTVTAVSFMLCVVHQKEIEEGRERKGKRRWQREDREGCMWSAAEYEMWQGLVSGCALNDPGPLSTHFISKAQLSSAGGQVLATVNKTK